MYDTYYNTDITKLVDTAIAIFAEKKEISRLKYQRRLIMIQKELADVYGELRMIKANEQNYQDISKEEVSMIFWLVMALPCGVKDVL